MRNIYRLALRTDKVLDALCSTEWFQRSLMGNDPPNHTIIDEVCVLRDKAHDTVEWMKKADLFAIRCLLRFIEFTFLVMGLLFVTKDLPNELWIIVPSVMICCGITAFALIVLVGMCATEWEALQQDGKDVPIEKWDDLFRNMKANKKR